MVIFFRRKSNSLGFKSSGEQGVRVVKNIAGGNSLTKGRRLIKIY
jgi:hypothetical protein